jgi:uncharacterized protein YqhQ
MMRGQKVSAVAVRAPDQSIVLKVHPLSAIYSSRLAKIPFLRGLLMLWDALGTGISALTFSANIQAGEEQEIEGAPMFFVLLLSLAMGIGLFILLPAGAAFMAERYLAGIGWSSFWSSLLEGLIRLALLVGYIWAIGLTRDIGRVYAYHGAEHKTINAFEAGASLTPSSVARFSREHPRCGTSFLLTVVVLSVLLFSLLGPMPLWLRLLSRLALVPVLASLAYEYIRLSGRISHHAWGRLLIAPNLALQQLSSKEPDEKMIEVAIAAFEAMRTHEAQPESAPLAPGN